MRTTRCAPARLVQMGLMLLLALITATAAHAHPAPFSYLDLHVGADRIDGTLSVHIIDVAHELRLANPDELLDPEKVEQHQQAIGKILASRIALRGDTSLSFNWTGIHIDVEKTALMLTLRVATEKPGALNVRTNLFPYDPQHQTFVNIYEGETLRQQWIFARGGGERTYYAGTASGVLAVMKTFIPAGFHHILIGPDHLLFLLGLLLMAGSWATLIRIVTAFTIGHSVTLSLAALGLVMPPANLIEPAIALTIIVVGVDNLMRGDGRDLRIWAALIFGLIHGFGFANVLREFGLPSTALGWSLFSFNFGVELGQLAVVVPLTLLLRYIWRHKPDMARRIMMTGSVVVIAAGSYWFIQRTIFPGGM